ncbi:response regulator [Tolumonas lignilytica]|jgi:Response regulator containing a CheY-like receiver domain and an HD-GYP domain|uniref:response regulator n=1 Tax=Tolumonas lignilytica TaxID=1283284 RepID=UPI000464F914|nr:HD domain-containing phosphohydrolase [Tolumonas lignilytica]
MEKKILLVDDEPNNLQLLRQILRDDYQLLFAHNGQTALDAVTAHHPDLILLDVMMPDLDGYEVCRRLKANPLTSDIPVIFITAMGEVDDEAAGFDVGAVDYIHKPVSPAIVSRRVQTHLSLVHIKELEDSQREAIYMLGAAGHYNDNDTGLHIWRMAAYARAIAEAAGWPEDLAERIELAAPLHDTGKIGIPDGILKAPRKLTAEEWVIMRQHTTIGYDILQRSDTPIFKMAAEIALHHHEKWDGSGYPNGLVGNQIPASAQIVALADVFDALTMKRSYKEAWSAEEAVAEIRANSGTHFNPALVELFLNIQPRIIEIKDKWNQEE